MLSLVIILPKKTCHGSSDGDCYTQFPECYGGCKYPSSSIQQPHTVGLCYFWYRVVTESASLFVFHIPGFFFFSDD